MVNNATFENDLKFVANKVSDALNMFNETVVSDNKLVTLYGQDEFIALFITPYENNKEWGQLRLRTKDMAATWENVPVGFSKINESRGLLSDMKRSARVSLKRNSIWYIDRQIKDTVGDRIVFTELTTNKGYLYKTEFTNGFVMYLSIVKDDREYHKPHDTAQLYVIASKSKEPLSPPMTADECISMLVNIAMQTDIRVSEFIRIAEQNGGKTVISSSYRTQDGSLDEVKAVFPNGYALKLRIQDDEILAEIFGRYEKDTYMLDARKFNDIKNVFETIKEISLLSNFNPD